jgi:hypothetical protein
VTITFPPWYLTDRAKQLTDAEFLLKGWATENITGDINVVSWLPVGDKVLADVESGISYLRIFRIGGIMSIEDSKSWVDTPRIQFAAICPTRDESWQVITFIRTVLWQYHLHSGRLSGAGIYTMCKTIGEVEGPQLTPVQFRDERLVPVTFDLEMSRAKGLPDYRIDLGL